jgi:hypothetical protein
LDWNPYHKISMIEGSAIEDVEGLEEEGVGTGMVEVDR